MRRNRNQNQLLLIATLVSVLVFSGKSSMAADLVGQFSVPSISLDKSASGVLRTFCHKSLMFVSYSSLTGGDTIQLFNSINKNTATPHICSSAEFIIESQTLVPSTKLCKGCSEIGRIFEIKGEKILLLSRKNGSASITQIFE